MTYAPFFLLCWALSDFESLLDRTVVSGVLALASFMWFAALAILLNWSSRIRGLESALHTLIGKVFVFFPDRLLTALQGLFARVKRVQTEIASAITPSVPKSIPLLCVRAPQDEARHWLRLASNACSPFFCLWFTVRTTVYLAMSLAISVIVYANLDAQDDPFTFRLIFALGPLFAGFALAALLMFVYEVLVLAVMVAASSILKGTRFSFGTDRIWTHWLVNVEATADLYGANDMEVYVPRVSFRDTKVVHCEYYSQAEVILKVCNWVGGRVGVWGVQDQPAKMEDGR
jgi:hypothetical protein